MAHIIAIAYYVGGVGKTTTTLNLGHALAQTGRRVLLCDLDPQGDLSDRLGLDPDPPTLRDALTGGGAVTIQAAHGMHVIPASLDSLAGVEMALVATIKTVITM